MGSKTSIVLSGVGGQGIITAGNILGKTALRAKINVYVSETHGLAQRGGAVNSMVRMGDVTSPFLATGTADAIVSTEPIEALRNIIYANKKTIVITDINPVIPFTVTLGYEKYQNLDDVFTEIKSRAKLYKIDALHIAKESGDPISKNIVLLGALAAADVLPFKHDILLETTLDDIPPRYESINRKAFECGMRALEDQRCISLLLQTQCLRFNARSRIRGQKKSD